MTPVEAVKFINSVRVHNEEHLMLPPRAAEGVSLALDENRGALLIDWMGERVSVPLGNVAWWRERGPTPPSAKSDKRAAGQAPMRTEEVARL